MTYVKDYEQAKLTRTESVSWGIVKKKVLRKNKEAVRFKAGL